MARVMSEAVFRVAYDGEAVRDGEMDVGHLAPALLAIGQTLKAAGRLLDGDDSEVSVRVSSTRAGCFEVWLSVVVNDAKIVWAWWKSPDVQAASQLVSVLGFTGVTTSLSVLNLVKRLRGRRAHSITPKDGKVEIKVDGEVIEADETVARVALDPNVREALERVVADPLDVDGIDSVSFGEAAKAEVVSRDQREWFRAPTRSDDDEFVSKQVRPFSIATLSFKTGQKWKLSDGHGAPRAVVMSDLDFAAKVDRSEEAFRKGDLLICEVVERSRRTAAGGFRSEYEVVKVLEHRPAITQGSLPLGDGPGPAQSDRVRE
jgi:hypothetical protein